MSRKTYTFVAPSSNSYYVETPLDQLTIFQMCLFPIRTEEYECREVIINENNICARYRNFTLSKRKCEKLYSIIGKNKCLTYPVISLRDTPLPSPNDISVARSDLANDDTDVCDFAKFETSKTDFNWRGAFP